MAKYDFMSFGEAMVRFTPPGHDRLGQAEVLELGIAAAELNCCVNISNLSRKLLKPQMKTAYVTKLVDAWDGDYIIKHAQMQVWICPTWWWTPTIRSDATAATASASSR